MNYKPYDYQKFATNYIESHPVAAVFLDMGLGKTSITLTAISNLLFDSFAIHKVLVIAPLRVARSTWSDEMAKWDHLHELEYSIIVGTAKERMAALRRRADIYIINRENLDWLVDKSGEPFNFDMVVIDELSSFKNYKAKRFRSLMKVRPFVKRIVGLTGTPASNGLMDLFAEFKVLDMGERLGRYITHYRNKYFLPDKRNGQQVFSYKLQRGAEEAIYRRILDITISMKATDYLQMPELISTEYEVTLDEDERDVYDQLKKEMVLSLKDGEITAANAASLTGKLMQMANGAVYGDDESALAIHNQKLDALEDIIEAANGKPLLVAYWFKHDLVQIKSRFDVREIKTAQDIHDWNDGNITVGVIHPAAAGHGLNLQSGGNHLVWFGLTWSLELYQQTNARLYRQGQSATSVIIQHIVAKDTIDEHILLALKHKDTSQSALIAAVKAEVMK